MQNSLQLGSSDIFLMVKLGLSAFGKNMEVMYHCYHALLSHTINDDSSLLIFDFGHLTEVVFVKLPHYSYFSSSILYTL